MATHVFNAMGPLATVRPAWLGWQWTSASGRV